MLRLPRRPAAEPPVAGADEGVAEEADAEWPDILKQLRLLNFVAFCLHATVAVASVAWASQGSTYLMRLTRNTVVVDKDWAFKLAACSADCFSPSFGADGKELVGICVNGVGAGSDSGSCTAPNCEDSLSVVMSLFSQATPVFQFPLVFLVGVLQACTAFAHFWLWSARMDDDTWRANMTANCQPLRWLEYSVTAGLMTVVIASLGRITDVYTLLGLLLSTVLTMVCGYEVERESSIKRKKYWWFFGAFAFGCTWYVILSNYISFVTFFDSAEGTKNFAALIDTVWNDPERSEFLSDIPDLLKFAIFVPFSLFLVFGTLSCTVVVAQSGGGDYSEIPSKDSYGRRCCSVRGSRFVCFLGGWACCCCCTKRCAKRSILSASTVMRVARSEGQAEEGTGATGGGRTRETHLIPRNVYALGVERSYIALSFVSKLALASLLSIGVNQAERDPCEGVP